MSGIFPQEHAGGLPVRDENGQPIVYDNVENAFVPPTDFSVTCSINYLPSDCTARFEPRQLNAIQSELLSIAVRLDPQGTWDCDSVTNLPRMFDNWLASDDFYNNISTSVCTRAGTHTKTAAQARVLRMLHCGENGIQASTFGNLTDVTLCGYGSAIDVNPAWGIITCGSNGPIKVTYEILYNYLYVRMGIQQIKEDILELQGDVQTIKSKIAVLEDSLQDVQVAIQSMNQTLNNVMTEVAEIQDELLLINNKIVALENNQITGAGFDDTTYNITITRQGAASFAVDLTPIKTAIDSKFNKPAGTTAQYVRGDGSLGNISTFQAVSQKNQANGYAGLDASGKIPESLIPALAISEPFVVASEAQMLALTAQAGDVAIRTDINDTFILKTAPASTLANWIKVLTPTTGIVSIAGLTNPNISQTELRTALGLGSAAYQPESAFVKPTGGAGDYIKGDGTIAPFPSVPGAQVQTDWNATSGIASIKNKPTNFVFGDGTTAQYIRGDGTKATFPDLGTKVNKAGDTMTGLLSAPGFTCTGDTITIQNDGASHLWLRNAAGTEKGVIWCDAPGQPMRLRASGGSTYVFQTDGSFVSPGNIGAYSDRRLKKRIETIADALDTVCKLRGTSYIKDGKRQFGLIAQEVYDVVPQAVHVSKDSGDYFVKRGEMGTLSVFADNTLLAFVIEAVKQLRDEVNSLKGV